MIHRLSHVTIFVKNQDEALKFYIEKLGFEKRMDAKFGGFRWLTVAPPDQKEVEMILLCPGDMFDAVFTKKFEELMDAGKLGGGVFQTEDCKRTYEELKAKGVLFKGPPEKKPYGVQATLCDNSNNWFSLTQPK